MWKRKVFKTGGSLAIVIPAKLAEMKGWRFGSEVVITVGRDKSVKMEGVMQRKERNAASQQ